MQVNTPKICLHFDVNKTIILKDSGKNMSATDTIISLLAETTIFKWNQDNKEMSYKNYVETILFPGSKFDPNIKTSRNQAISNFLQEVKKYPEIQGNVEKTYQAIIQKFTQPATGKIQFTVFPSFYKLVEKLTSIKDLPFKIILRTFGNDLEEVMDEITSHPKGIKITQKGYFKDKTLHINQNTYSKVQDIFQAFLFSSEHLGIQDNYQEWYQNKESADFGKLFPYENHPNAKHYFFDDNITLAENDIVNPQEIHGQNFDKKSLKDKVLFTVDTLEAILDDSYFINLLQNLKN